MGIFFSCLETKPCLQEHVSLTEKTCPCHGVKKRPIRSSNRGEGGAAEVDNTLSDQSFSSYHTKAEFNNCFLKYFQALNKLISSYTFFRTFDCSRQFPKIEFFFL